MIKVRLHGLAEENLKFIELLKALNVHAPDNLKLRQVSQPYKDRGASEYERIYIELDLDLNLNPQKLLKE